MSAITFSKTIEVLRSVFVVYGLPETIVTDNGPSFTSEEFAQFMARNKIKHVKLAPYHPSSTGKPREPYKLSNSISNTHKVD